MFYTDKLSFFYGIIELVRFILLNKTFEEERLIIYMQKCNLAAFFITAS